jgi:hypothetical protein
MWWGAVEAGGLRGSPHPLICASCADGSRWRSAKKGKKQDLCKLREKETIGTVKKAMVLWHYNNQRSS